MSEEKRPCRRCQRAIDGSARICPFCNWDQTSTAAPVKEPVPLPVAQYRPPEEYDIRKKLVAAGIGVLVLVASFVIGMLINRDGAPKVAPETVEEQVAEEKARPPKRADTPLVPTNEPGGIEQPITSAPVAPEGGSTPDDFNRTDATAVSATEYQQMAKRAQAEKEKMAAFVDPRSITGPAYAQAQRVANRGTSGSPSIPGGAAERPERRMSVRTRPVPQYQPLPQIDAKGTARLSLLIGADGRVKRVDIERALDGNTAQLIATVQSWRFKPATENGEPVAAPYSVEISFN